MVLKSGDLTEEQARNAEKEAATKPRDATNERVMFKKPTKTSNNSEEKDNKKTELKKFASKKVKNKSLLSFAEEDDDES